MRFPSLILLLLLLNSCARSTIDYNNRVENWPTLEPRIHVVSYDEMYKVCSKYGEFGKEVLACAKFTYDPPICDVWVTDPDGWTLQHELDHCLGYDHPGSNEMRNNFQKRMNKLK